MFFPQPKDSSFELKSPTNMTLSDRLLMVCKRLGENLLYNRADAECNGANTFFSVKDGGVLRFFSK